MPNHLVIFDVSYGCRDKHRPEQGQRTIAKT